MKPVLRLCVTIVLVIAATGCARTESQNTEAGARILALGDSYTIGEGVSPEERWPNQLTDLLREHGLAVKNAQIIAATGWTTADLELAVERQELTPPYDLVTLLIGVNDQYQGRSVDRYRDGFTGLFGKAVELTGGDPQRVIVLSIPDYSVTPFAQGRDAQTIRIEIDLFNRINLEIAQALGARYVDVTPISRRAAYDPALIASDGLHPSGKMYAQWAQLVLPTAVAALDADNQR